MLRCNLAVLMAERQLKITRIAKDTGISRTTLTMLSNNTSQGIQFDTLNALCRYLKVSPSDFLLFIPFDFDIKLLNILSEEMDLFELMICVHEGKVDTQCLMNCHCYYVWEQNEIGDVNVFLGFPVYTEESGQQDTQESRAALYRAFSQMKPALLLEINVKIIEVLKKNITFPFSNTAEFSVAWPEDLQQLN